MDGGQHGKSHPKNARMLRSVRILAQKPPLPVSGRKCGCSGASGQPPPIARSGASGCTPSTSCSGASGYPPSTSCSGASGHLPSTSCSGAPGAPPSTSCSGAPDYHHHQNPRTYHALSQASKSTQILSQLHSLTPKTVTATTLLAVAWYTHSTSCVLRITRSLFLYH